MTANTLSRLPLLAGSAAAATLSRAGLWTFSRYMRAPLASTATLAMVTLTALAASNALYFQTTRHPAPFFSPAVDVPVPQSAVAPELFSAPVPQSGVLPAVAPATTGSVAATPVAVPNAPVGNAEAFAVQKKLTELGLFNGTVDGFYGPMTANAIRAFETRNGMNPTGALSRTVIDAILRADGNGVSRAVPQAAVQPVPAPVPQAAVQPVPAPVPQAAPADIVVARVAELSPVENAVDTIGNAAANTLDSIVAAVDGRGSNPALSAARPVPSQAIPAPVQMASLEPVSPPRPVTAEVATPSQVAAVANVAPANNTQLVSTIQKGLASLGFYHGSIDGHPGDGTARAIREFENFHSYRVTGAVNSDLVGLLRQAGASI